MNKEREKKVERETINSMRVGGKTEVENKGQG